MDETVAIARGRYGYGETLGRLSRAIGEAGHTLFTAIDQAQAARGAGLEL